MLVLSLLYTLSTCLDACVYVCLTRLGC